LGAFAEQDTKMLLGTCVVIVPLRHPAILAKEVASLDYLSNGRIVLGVGVGPSNRREIFEVFGVNPKERGARTDEALTIINGLWTGKPFSYKGRFYEFKDIIMEPKPVQRPRPPIWVGGESEAALKRTARYGDGFVPAGSTTPATYDRAMLKITRYCEELGRDPSKITRALHLYFHIAESRHEAVTRANEALKKRVGINFGIKPQQGAVLGSADDCARDIERFISCGVEHIVVNPACDRSEFFDQIELFASAVMSRFI